LYDSDERDQKSRMTGPNNQGYACSESRPEMSTFDTITTTTRLLAIHPFVLTIYLFLRQAAMYIKTLSLMGFKSYRDTIAVDPFS
jgi:hypothetical protein